MSSQYLEIFLVCINLLIWLAPAAVSMKRRTLSLLHPSIVFPILVSLSMMVAMTENWFHWGGRGSFPGLRITTRFFYFDPDFYIMPLAILAAAGLAYFLGVRLGCGRIIPVPVDRIHLTEKMPFVPKEFGNQLVPVAAIVSIISLTPFLLFGQGQEFFWATALVYAFNFIPALMYRQDPVRGTVFLILGLFAVGFRGSKGDFIYYFLPLLIFFQLTMFKGKKKIEPAKIVLLLMIGVAMVAGTVKMHQERGYWNEEDTNQNLAAKILVREYGFEVFAILGQESGPWGNVFGISPYGSWFVQEMKEAVPSFLGVDKLRMGQEVAKSFMPFDYSYLSEAGFYRFFLFPFYYDLGLIGALLGSFSLGLIIAFAYRLALNKTMALKTAWPLFVYLPVPVYSELIVNGAYSYAFIHIGVAATAIWVTARLTLLNVFGLSGFAGEAR